MKQNLDYLRSVRMKTITIEKLKVLAKQKGCSVNRMINTLLEYALKNYIKK